MDRFKNRVVIVTGGAKGIGYGCASVFCGEGGRVVILDRDATAGYRTAEQLTALGPGTVEFRGCDVSRVVELQERVAEVVRDYGRLDCLINNAGVHPPATPLEATSLESVEELFRINYLSMFAASQASARYLRETRGTIVNISSMTAVLGQEHSAAYASTKAAQLGFTKSLALELGREGVRVNAILPSNIDTPLMHEWAATLADPATALQRVAELQVFGRMGRPEEIGTVALFLATEDSSFVTGQAIEVEGGSSLDY